LRNSLSLKAQLLIISRKFRHVNPILILLIVLALLLSNCGFRLNRNQISLPENAQSISLQNIENRSFTPRLDILLKDILIDRFSRNAVEIKPAQLADLSLTIQIDSANDVRQDYALDNTTSSYEFIFTITAKLSVTLNSNKTQLIKNQLLRGSHSIKTESTDLSQTEIADGRVYALENLGDQIIAKLSQNF
jgi:outer membrane lipopolysaccharide assembly protein LptE/RlpB